MFRIALLFLALLVSTLLAFGFYVSHRFARLMESPEVALIATPAHLTAPATPRPSPVALSAPVADTTADNRATLDSISRLLGKAVPSRYEMHKRALAAAPFSTWGIPFRGVQRSKIDIALLSLKYKLLAGATAVELYETPRVGALIIHRPRQTVVVLTDRQHSVSQDLVLGQNVPHADEIIATAVTTYAANLTQ